MKSRTPKRFLRNKDGRVLHWSKYLAQRNDLVECDVNGMPLGMVGIKPPKVIAQTTATPEPVEEMPEPEIPAEKPEAKDGDPDFENMKPKEICEAAVEKFGEDASHMKPQWGKPRLVEEWGRLEAMMEIR